MTEAFLSYVWKLRLYNQNGLRTTTGEEVQIVSTGESHTSSGPDFFNAKIKIGDTLWAGNVEIHIKSSDWLKHQHQHDGAYQNIILHVVYEDDIPLINTAGSNIPTLELQKFLDPRLYRNYLLLLGNSRWIPCEKFFPQTDNFVLSNWLDRLLVERLEQKTLPIMQVLENNLHNWEETFYQFLARSFGAKANAEPFELLAKSLPSIILAKYKDKLFQLEALLFGMSGLLNQDFKDDYPVALKKEFQFLQQKHQLKSLPGHLWKFGGLRPPNFPTIRLAQFALMFHQSASGLFSHILEAETKEAYKNMLSVSISGYWKNHYVFDKESKSSNKTLGNPTIYTIIINTIAPVLFVYGNARDIPELKDKALQLLEQLPAETNHIVDHWKSLGVKTKSAHQTQALLQLFNEYCSRKRCLHCAIGSKLVRSNEIND
ncbi:MAG: DUF2851 family protein [Sphingobacteriales bacterium]|nr:MAG: DUF2851 family protein [Sphingobacteriales bacterium]